MHNRQSALNQWLEQILAPKQFTLTPLTGDASFRHYFRLHQPERTLVIMDAPPDKEPLEPFVSVAHLFTAAGVRTPFIHALDKTQGFVALEDFGDTLLLNRLNQETSDKLYKSSMAILTTLQNYPLSEMNQLPFFDEEWILKELNIFSEWFLQTYLHIQLSKKEKQLITETFTYLSDEIMQQPKVIIHRDYHSRNIMLLNKEEENIELGVIDFQDAMVGPFTYDLASLLKDCYIQWPREEIITWLSYFHSQTPISQKYSLPHFIRAFDYCGLQRHLKVLGVFSRLALRDSKPNYLRDLPLTLNYVMACLECYDELKPFYTLMQERISLP